MRVEAVPLGPLADEGARHHVWCEAGVLEHLPREGGGVVPREPVCDCVPLVGLAVGGDNLQLPPIEEKVDELTYKVRLPQFVLNRAFA